MILNKIINNILYSKIINKILLIKDIIMQKNKKNKRKRYFTKKKNG
ncbi:hypothetical protein ONB69_00230 [Candidatus Purcelliella pentastirinorum]|nr:hypothetical protein [Candidatus Purcelliella pentastirinorum]WDI78989.1 hypothetical protein ONB68_00265 [Candidatus Purcelliella pentastirinorum]WDR80125.1 hypothetical protein ONB69_00230 [Candidatus Purcelliella pentastirinorum]